MNQKQQHKTANLMSKKEDKQSGTVSIKEEKIIPYIHVYRETPDRYHIDAIKQYKRELDQIRRNYEELRRAYYYLLGYRIQGCNEVPKVLCPKDKNYLCVTQVSQQNQPSSHHNSSIIQINSAISQIDQNTRRINKIDKMAESIIQFHKNSSNSLNNKLNGIQKNAKMKTQYGDEIEEQLLHSIKQIQYLKNQMKNNKQIYDFEVREVKLSYEEHIRKLEEILQRERRHTKMLNGVIARLRSQIQSKDKLIKEIMRIKNSDKNAVQKLVRQFKISF